MDSLSIPLIAGAVLGLSLAAPPGPVTALMAREVARRGPWAGAAVGLGATAADGCFLVLASAGALAVLGQRPWALGALSLAGAVLLAWYAWGAWRAARADRQLAEEAPGARRAGFVAGFLAAATSPFNAAWWLGPGTALLASSGPWLAVGMFAAILSWVAFFNHALSRLGNRVGRFQERLAYASAAVLLAFGLWVAWRGLQLLGVLPGPA